MPTARAQGELLASPEGVWSYLSEPHHLTDWWPGLGVAEADRPGLEVGARWRLRSNEPTLLRGTGSEDTLLVRAADPGALFAFELVKARLKVELALEPAGPATTSAALSVSGPFFLGFSRSLPGDALSRLHDVCQTGAHI